MDYSSDDEPLARLVDRLTQSKNADGLLTDSGSDFTPEICGVKNCKSVADNECDHCDMALCKDHSGTTNCDKKHIIPKKTATVNNKAKSSSCRKMVNNEHLKLIEFEQQYCDAYKDHLFPRASLIDRRNLCFEFDQLIEVQQEYENAVLRSYLPQNAQDQDRGRKRKRLSKEERQLRVQGAKNRKIQIKKTLKPSCTEKCSLQCSKKVQHAERLELNNAFWNGDFVHRRDYIRHYVQKTPIKRRRVESVSSRRSYTYSYNLPDANGVNVPVCKTMFCSVLNISDKAIRNAIDMKNDVNDLRGKHPHPEHSFDHDLIKADIERYNPCIHHYRREHAPLRRYLPSDIKIADMHREFNKERPKPVSYSLYQKVFREMNISMTKLGNEECEECQKYFIHKETHKECDSCEICDLYRAHKARAEIARKKYKDDADALKKDDEVIVSADLQKVIMLPRIEMFKTAIFTRRLCLFNETFAEVGKKKLKKEKNNKAFLWHEGVSGRNDEDIASTFWLFLRENRDARFVTIWLDNCAGQNKNWTLFTVLSTAVNCEHFKAEKVRLNFFESGHTFMSADSAHAEIEESMRNKKQIFDFDDFCACVDSTSCKAIVMETRDFRKWTSGTSQYKLRQSVNRPMLADISVVEFRRGSPNLFYKKAHDCDYFTSFSFLKSNFVLEEKKSKSLPRGISQKKKDDIIKNLLQLMPANRRAFWINLHISDVPDLIDNI